VRVGVETLDFLRERTRSDPIAATRSVYQQLVLTELQNLAGDKGPMGKGADQQHRAQHLP